jgi:DNA-binding XRE family transcriptional regulator
MMGKCGSRHADVIAGLDNLGAVLNENEAKIASVAARIDQHVGERIRRRRTLLGFTQEQLAEALEISYQQIQKYETGSNRVSAGRLFQISQRLDVPMNYFFDGLESHAVAASSGGSNPATPYGNGSGTGNGNGNGAPARTTIELVRNFNQIDDNSVRAAVSALVKSLSVRSENDPDGDDASAFGEFAAAPKQSGS